MGETIDWSSELIFRQVRQELKDLVFEAVQATKDREALDFEELNRTTRTILYLVDVERVSDSKENK